MAKYDGKKKGFNVIPARTKDFQTSIKVLCRDRTDEWSQIVLGCLQYAQDLHAADTVYHQSCSVNFRTGKRIPKQYNSDSNDDKGVKKPKQGQPVDTVKSSAFMKVVQYLEENDEEQTTVSDLARVMG